MHDTVADFLDRFPDIIGPEQFSLEHTRSMAVLISRDYYAPGRLVECRRTDDGTSELLVVDLEAELGQRPNENDIRNVERVGILVTSDDRLPSVFSLRQDFPLVPHLGLRLVGWPRSLCLYDQSWAELAPGWTAWGFVERIRWWFAKTAYGELHGEHQPLEPLFATGSYRLIIPRGLAGTEPGIRVNAAVTTREGFDDKTLFFDHRNEAEGLVTFSIAIVQGQPKAHGLIEAAPRTLHELIDICREMGTDLNEDLRDQIHAVAGDLTVMRQKLLLLLLFPVQRRPDGTVEEHQIFACMTKGTLGDVGVALDCVEPVDPHSDGNIQYGVPLGEQTRFGETIDLFMVEVFEAFSRETAERASGLEKQPEVRVVLVGAGALGSEIADLFARRGFGTWTIIDKDVLLPHNMARHVLPGFAVGKRKAVALATHIRNILNEDTAALAIYGNILEPQAEIQEAIQACDLLIDASASMAVSRSLSHQQVAGRRVSAFLNPAGTDAVLLGEDGACSMPLDLLDQCYWRAVALDEALAAHLAPAGEGFHYNTSCASPSATIAGSTVSALASVLAPQIAMNQPGPIASMWRLDPSNGAINRIGIPLCEQTIAVISGWELYLLDAALNEILGLREQRLPNETGGILMGYVDRLRKRIDVHLALPAPPDSKERRTSFIRGVAGLRTRVGTIRNRTLDHVTYVGEWHSHPRGSSLAASQDDRKLYSWIHDGLEIEEIPPLMLIVGDAGARAYADVGDGTLAEADFPS